MFVPTFVAERKLVSTSCSYSPLVLTSANVRLQLAEEEKNLAAAAVGPTPGAHTDITASLFIYQGIELEEARCVTYDLPLHCLSDPSTPPSQRHALQTSELGQHSTDLQRTRVLEHRNALERRFDAWVTIQGLYMPAVASYRMKTGSPSQLSGTTASIHDARFMLPSEVSGSVAYDPALSQYEMKFRVAQGYSTLSTLRGLLLSRSLLLQSKKKHVSGQVQVTRSEGLIQTLSRDVNRTADRYRHAHKCMLRLASVVPAETAALARVFKRLDASDLSGLTSLEGGSEGHKQLSWIWTVGGVGENEGDASDTCG